MEILELRALDAGYSSKLVLQDVHLMINAGQFVSIVAPNGAGKSTLLKTVSGVLPPLNGAIFLKGKPLNGFSRRETAREIAVVGSELPVLDYTTLQMVTMGRFPHICRLAGLKTEDHSVVQAIMENVGIWEKRLCQCRELSQGERQKVIIARALAQKPKLLLLDEPTAHLDICNQFAILQLIKNLALYQDMAVIAVIHDINLALQFSTQLMFLKNGRILAYGKPQDVATTEVLKSLYGMNFNIYSDAAATYVRPNLA
ncbi:MAG: yusV 2 [Firmicutes bacterium]|nr:yusV 2 [Bacillota bacterium]